MRGHMHGALLALAAFALLPFLVVAGGLLFMLLAATVPAVLGIFLGGNEAPIFELAEAGAHIVKGGAKLVPRYYRFLGKRRRPVLWGLLTGVLFGGLVLWAVLAIVVLPDEALTVERLAAAKERIDEDYRRTGQFPKPDDDGHIAVLSIDGKEGAEAVADGFGRLVRYEVKGKWAKLSSYRLVSAGFDGVEGTNDDLCIEGSTELRRFADKALNLADLVRGIAGGNSSAQDKLRGIRAMKCQE